jgi:hypothetical protein
MPRCSAKAMQAAAARCAITILLQNHMDSRSVPCRSFVLISDSIVTIVEGRMR